MTTPTHDPDLIAQRRARVAQLKLRALSSREIALALARGDANGNGRIVNPHTGQPYQHATILADLKFLQNEWKEERVVNTDTHVDRQFMEMQEIKRTGWATAKPELVLSTLREEMNLLGTKKPQEVNINFNFDVEIVMRLAAMIEAKGENPNQWFSEMLQDFMDADSEEVQIAQGIINAHRESHPDTN